MTDSQQIDICTFDRRSLHKCIVLWQLDSFRHSNQVLPTNALHDQRLFLVIITWFQCLCYFHIIAYAHQRLRKLVNKSSLRFEDVNKRLDALQAVEIIPHPTICIRTCPNARKYALVILSSSITTIYGISHRGIIVCLSWLKQKNT